MWLFIHASVFPYLSKSLQRILHSRPKDIQDVPDDLYSSTTQNNLVDTMRIEYTL